MHQALIVTTSVARVFMVMRECHLPAAAAVLVCALRIINNRMLASR